MSEKIREEFEAWFLIVTGVDIELNRDGVGYKCEDGESTRYLSGSWLSWQASRAALVVELPDATGYPLAYHEAISDVEDALDAAGVGYK